MFAFAYLVATWANYLVLWPDQPYLWWPVSYTHLFPMEKNDDGCRR